MIAVTDESDSNQNNSYFKRLVCLFIRLYVTLTPISLPIPNVIAAAANPNITCLKPEYQILFPVKRVMAAPIMNKPTALAAALKRMALVPLKKRRENRDNSTNTK